MTSSGHRTDSIAPKPILQLCVLAAGNALLAFVLCVVVPAMPGMATHFASEPNSVFKAQLLLVGPFIPLIVAAPLVGAIVGSFGRRWPLLLALATLALSGSAGFWVENFWTLLAFRLISGFAASAIGTIDATLVGDYFTGRMRDRAVAWLGIVPSFGSIVALLLGGYLARIGGWHLPFLLFLIAVPVFIVAFFVIEEPRITAAPARSAASASGRLPVGMTALTFWMVVAGIATLLSSVQLPFLMIGLGVTDPSIPATILGTSAIAATTGAALYPWLKPRLRRSALLAIVFLFMGLSYVATGFAAAVPFIWTLMMLSGFGSGLVLPYFTGAAMELASAEARPRAMGLIIGAMFAGQFLAPFVSEPLRDFVGGGGVFEIWGGVFTLVGLWFLLQSKQRKPIEVRQ
jgi:MFS family permease